MYFCSSCQSDGFCVFLFCLGLMIMIPWQPGAWQQQPNGEQNNNKLENDMLIKTPAELLLVGPSAHFGARINTGLYIYHIINPRHAHYQLRVVAFEWIEEKTTKSTLSLTLSLSAPPQHFHLRSTQQRPTYNCARVIQHCRISW